METGDPGTNSEEFQYWNMGKKFRPGVEKTRDIRSISLAHATSRLKQERQSRKVSPERSKLHAIIEKYMSKPFGVVGQNLDEEGSTKSKASNKTVKFQTNVTCMQCGESKVRTLERVQENKSPKEPFSSNENLSMVGLPKQSVGVIRQTNEGTEVRAPNVPSIHNLSMVSHPVVIREHASSEELPVYDDDFFDFLNIPGHFNTRGVFGQKASVGQTAPQLFRSNTDLTTIKKSTNSDSARSVSGVGTSVLPNLRRIDTFGILRKVKNGDKNQFTLPKLSHSQRNLSPKPVNKSKSNSKHRKSDKLNTHKDRDVKVSSHKDTKGVDLGVNTLEMPSIFTDTSTAFKSTSARRNTSIDICVQTDPLSSDDDGTMDFMYTNY